MLMAVVQRGGGGAAAFINKVTGSATLSFDELKKAADAAVSAGQDSLVEEGITPRDSSLYSGEEDTDDQAGDESDYGHEETAHQDDGSGGGVFGR